LLAKLADAELKLKELKERVRPSIKEAASLIATMAYRNIRTPAMIPNIVAGIVGGFNEDSSVELYSVSPAGDLTLIKNFVADGSGMIMIYGLLERQYKKDMSIEEGVELAKECLKSSTQRDTASGNGIDVFAITKDGIKHVVAEEILPEYKHYK
jgi:proteasome beta subunit